jgi:hypothetical protein
MRRLEADIEALGQQYRMPVDPGAAIWQLSVGEQQRVEILKLLYRGADILILDEPTAVLTPQESRELAHILRNMANEGKSIVFISHKLDEVMAYTDRVTVLRDRKNVATLNTSETSKAELAREMVGREVLFRVAKEATAVAQKSLALENVSALNNKGLPALQKHFPRHSQQRDPGRSRGGRQRPARTGRSDHRAAPHHRRPHFGCATRISPTNRRAVYREGGRPHSRRPAGHGVGGQSTRQRQPDYEGVSPAAHRFRPMLLAQSDHHLRAEAGEEFPGGDAQHGDAGPAAVGRQPAKGDSGAGDRHRAELTDTPPILIVADHPTRGPGCGGD